MDSYIKEPTNAATSCVIWLHGLGSDGQNMIAFVDQLSIGDNVRHVFLTAPVRAITLNQGLPMRAWYDITGLGLEHREDREGLALSSEQIIYIIQQQIASGILPSKIFLAGFSQGGAMALFTGLTLDFAIGGIIALSAYLPLASEHVARAPAPVPVFIAVGTNDTIVLPQWSRHAYQSLLACNFTDVAWHEYAMEHTVCASEIKDVAQWLRSKTGI